MGLFAVVDDLNFCSLMEALHKKKRKYPSECVGRYNKHTKKENKRKYIERKRERGTETERERVRDYQILKHCEAKTYCDRQNKRLREGERESERERAREREREREKRERE